MSVTSAAFNATAIFKPSISPDTVLVSGTATNSSDIANIELFDGSTDLGGTGQFAGSGWGFVATLPPGKHILHGVLTTLSGMPASLSFNTPYELVTGIQNQPYVVQKLDENAFGVVDRVTDFDANGTPVSQIGVTLNGGAPSPFSVAFDPTASFRGATEVLITGTDAAAGSATAIEIYDGGIGSVVDPRTDTVLPGAQALGSAALDPDGTWTFDAHLSAGTHQFTAVATSIAGQTAVTQSAFTVLAGVVGSPYVYREIDHAAGGAVAATTSYDATGDVVGRSNDGGPTINGGSSTGQVLTSTYDDVMTGDGSGGTAFVFKRGFGQDEITNFNYLSPSPSNGAVPHDLISLPQSIFTNLAQVLRHTTSSLDGDAVIHLDRQDSIKLDGVTKADLVTNSNLFRFHT